MSEFNYAPLFIAGPSVVVHFNKLVPLEVKEALDPLLPLVVPFAPSWLHDLHIFWEPEPDNDGAAATIVAYSEYRFARLTIRPLLLSGTEFERRSNLLHEMLHLTLVPLNDLIQEMLTPIQKTNKALYTTLEKQCESIIEGVIVDLTRAFKREEDGKEIQARPSL